MPKFAWLAISFWISLVPAAADDRSNALPAEFERALSAPEHVEVFSLEPTQRDSGAKGYHGYKVLGHAPVEGEDAQTAIKEFKNAIARWNGAIAGCFEPRQALAVQYKGHTYEFLICYTCQNLAYFLDGKSIGDVGVTGSPDALKALLIKRGVTPSNSDVEQQLASEKRGKMAEAAYLRWLAAMPPVLRSVWDAQKDSPIPDVVAFRQPLQMAIPDERERILALLAWYGTDTDLWSGYAAYEDLPGRLLLDYPTARILEVAESAKLDNAQTEGLARLLAGWDFYKQRPNDLALVPTSLKRTLLVHSLASSSDDKKERARRAFDGR